MFDAYTIKKIMPRLVVAAIVIQLSWPLLTFGINLVAQLSWGLEGLLYLPFGGRDALEINKSLELAGGNFGFTELLGGATAWLAIGAPGLMAISIAVLMALVVAFFTLIIRQVLIIMLVLTAPLALVAWILPNTERLWKLWWGTLSKALLMYPLILLLVASGRITAHIVAVASKGDNMPQAIGLILIIVVFFGPFFLIAKTFQFAGGAISATAGAISARGSKMTGWAGKRSMAKQGQKWGERGQKAKAGELTPFKSINALTARGTTKNFGFGRKGRNAYTQKKDLLAMQHAKSDAGQAGQFNDGMLRAQTYRSASEASERMGVDFGMSDDEVKNSIAAAKANGGFGVNRQWYAAQQLARTKTGYDDAAQAMETIERITGGNSEDATSLRENIKFSSKQVGRNDMGALRAREEGESRQQWNNSMTSDGFENIDTFSLGREHAASYLNMATAHVATYNDALQAYKTTIADPTATNEQRQEARDAVIDSRTKLEETMKNASSATGKNSRIATRAARLVGAVDTDFRASLPAESLEILGVETPKPPQGITQGSIGGAGAARAPDDAARRIFNRDDT